MKVTSTVCDVCGERLSTDGANHKWAGEKRSIMNFENRPIDVTFDFEVTFQNADFCVYCMTKFIAAALEK